jgi:hypothetical protein
MGLGGYPPNNGDSFNLKLPSPTHTNSEISRVTHPPCLLRDCYWPSSKRPVNHHRILPPSSLACARSKRESVSQPPYLQRVVGTFTKPLHSSLFALSEHMLQQPLHFSCIMQTILSFFLAPPLMVGPLLLPLLSIAHHQSNSSAAQIAH